MNKIVWLRFSWAVGPADSVRERLPVHTECAQGLKQISQHLTGWTRSIRCQSSSFLAQNAGIINTKFGTYFAHVTSCVNFDYDGFSLPSHSPIRAQKRLWRCFVTFYPPGQKKTVWSIFREINSSRMSSNNFAMNVSASFAILRGAGMYFVVNTLEIRG